MKGMDKELSSLVASERGLALNDMFYNEAIRRDLFKSVTESWEKIPDGHLKIPQSWPGQNPPPLGWQNGGYFS